MPAVERSIEIQASPATVWSFFATQEGLRAWWGAEIEIDMTVGGKHRHYVPEVNQWISGYVLEIVPAKQLILSWFEEDCDWVFPTRLVFTLEAIPGGTRVTHRYDGFAGIGKHTWERTMQAYDRGIDLHNMLGALKAVAERYGA
jgi:uncharacterized protein YndB with AHSA1/START domain